MFVVPYFRASENSAVGWAAYFTSSEKVAAD
jgi:hypothetical protein